MCNKDQLVSYLYDDLDGGERAMFERHLRDCAECRDELKAMRSVRADLLTWTPPEPEFAFRIVREPKVMRPAVASWRTWWTPAAGFAAAAVLVLAAAASIAHVEIQKTSDGFAVRTGWSTAAPVAASVAGSGGQVRDVNLSAPGVAFVPDLGALERRVAALETASHEGSAFRNASTLSARASNAEVLKMVRDLLQQSESNQKRELAMRMTQLLHDVESQRVADLRGVQTNFTKIDQNVAEEAAAHRELMTYLLGSNSKQK
jgi:hypothetical protein